MFHKEYWAVIVSEDVAELTEQEFPAKNLAKQLGGVAKRVIVTEITEDKPKLVKLDAKSEQNLRPTGNGQDNSPSQDR